MIREIRHLYMVMLKRETKLLCTSGFEDPKMGLKYAYSRLLGQIAFKRYFKP